MFVPSRSCITCLSVVLPWPFHYDDVYSARKGGWVEILVVLVGSTDCADCTPQIVHRTGGGRRAMVVVRGGALRA